MFTGPNLATVYVTANGCTVSPDMRRRSLFVELHLEAERAEDRVFHRPLDLATLLRLRPQILASCWALVRNWVAKEHPLPSRTHTAFPEWAAVVGGIVEAAGYACPLDAADVAAVADEDGDDMRALVREMELKKEYDFRAIVDLCRRLECFIRLVGDEMQNKTRVSLARILSQYDNRQVGDRVFVVKGKGHARRYLARSHVKHADWADSP
jgi:hypothetical protein